MFKVSFNTSAVIEDCPVDAIVPKDSGIVGNYGI